MSAAFDAIEPSAVAVSSHVAGASGEDSYPTARRSRIPFVIAGSVADMPSGLRIRARSSSGYEPPVTASSTSPSAL